MKKRDKYLLSFFLILSAMVICFLIAIAIQKTWQASRRALTGGTVAAVAAALSEELHYSELRGEGDILREIFYHTNEYRFLTPEEYDQVIIELSKLHGRLDAPKGWQPILPLVDVWGNRLKIKYRTLPNGYINDRHIAVIYDFAVISKGLDGILQTKDDFSR